MQHKSLMALIDMGGQGIYIWSVYLIFFLFVVTNVLIPWLRHRSYLRRQAIIKQQRHESTA